MGYSSKEKAHYFTFFPAFSLGLKDSLSPCAVVTIFVFLIFLSRCGYSKKAIRVFGAFFIVAALLTNVSNVMGFFDAWFLCPDFIYAVRLAYIILAICFLVLGYVQFRDWIKYKKNQDTNTFTIKPPIFLNVASGSVTRTRKFLLFLSSIFLGSGFTLLSSYWPQDYYLSVLANYWYAGNQVMPIFILMFCYSAGFVFLLFLWWIFILYMAGSQAMKNLLNRYTGFLKILFSSLFLSIGLGLGFLFLK